MSKTHLASRKSAPFPWKCRVSTSPLAAQIKFCCGRALRSSCVFDASLDNYRATSARQLIEGGSRQSRHYFPAACFQLRYKDSSCSLVLSPFTAMSTPMLQSSKRLFLLSCQSKTRRSCHTAGACQVRGKISGGSAHGLKLSLCGFMIRHKALQLLGRVSAGVQPPAQHEQRAKTHEAWPFVLLSRANCT